MFKILHVVSLMHWYNFTCRTSRSSPLALPAPTLIMANMNIDPITEEIFRYFRSLALLDGLVAISLSKANCWKFYFGIVVCYLLWWALLQYYLVCPASFSWKVFQPVLYIIKWSLCSFPKSSPRDQVLEILICHMAYILDVKPSNIQKILDNGQKNLISSYENFRLFIMFFPLIMEY